MTPCSIQAALISRFGRRGPACAAQVRAHGSGLCCGPLPLHRVPAGVLALRAQAHPLRSLHVGCCCGQGRWSGFTVQRRHALLIRGKIETVQGRPLRPGARAVTTCVQNAGRLRQPGRSVICRIEEQAKLSELVVVSAWPCPIQCAVLAIRGHLAPRPRPRVCRSTREGSRQDAGAVLRW